MSVQDHLLDLVSDVSSQGEDHFLDPLDQEGEPIEQEEAAYRGIRQPRLAYRDRDLHYRGTTSNQQIPVVSNPPTLEDPGVSAIFIEK